MPSVLGGCAAENRGADFVQHVRDQGKTEMSTINDQPELYKEYFRDELIRSGGEHEFGVFSLSEEMSRMRIYLETMEGFIGDQKQNEIRQLEEQAKDMTAEEKSEFWSWYYPVHWDEMFASRLRSSFLILLVSFTESYLNQVCRDVAVIVRSAVKCSDLKGSGLGCSKKFLKKVGKFNNPSNDDWEIINCICDIRNVIVHNESSMFQYKKEKRLRQFVNKHPALSELSDYIELEKDFCFFCLERINFFLKTYQNEVLELCERVKMVESK